MLLLEGNLKKCSQCKCIKSFDLFSKNRTQKSGLSNICKHCNKINRYKLKQKEKIIPEYKKCCTCKQSKQSSYFYKNSNTLDGLNVQCKDCVRLDKKRYSMAVRAQITVKKCPVCNIEMLVGYFSTDKTTKDGYYGMCKSCKDKYRIEYVKKPEIMATNKTTREKYTKNNSDKIRRKSKEYRKNNKNKVDANRKSWKLRNPDKVKLIDQKKRCKRESVMTEKISVEEWQNKKAEFDHCCAYCGIKETYLNKLTIDHFIAISKGGPHTLFNLVPACRSCNAKKHNKHPFDFIFDSDLFQ